MFGVHKLAWLRRDSSKYLRPTLVKGLAWLQVAVRYRKTSNNFLIFSSCALLREKLAHLSHWLCTEKIITAFLPTPNSCPTNDTCCCSTTILFCWRIPYWYDLPWTFILDLPLLYLLYVLHMLVNVMLLALCLMHALMYAFDGCILEQWRLLDVKSHSCCRTEHVMPHLVFFCRVYRRCILIFGHLWCPMLLWLLILLFRRNCLYLCLIL